MGIESLFTIAQDAVVGGVPLIAVITGLVSFLKKIGVHGKWLTIASYLLGLNLGILYQVSLHVPSSFAEWFTVAIFGLGYGIVTSGIYDVLTKDVRGLR